MRYVKSGNRQINTALHRIAMTQLRDGAGQLYYRKRIEMGDPPVAALRRLKRRLARGVQPHESRHRGSQRLTYRPRRRLTAVPAVMA
jgi:hypothetical protein